MTATLHASPKNIHWFGASPRLIGGVPDARYGWLDSREGPLIVKALDPGLTAFAGTLLEHERQALRRLQALGGPIAAPCFEHMAQHPDWIVTRFGGLSLKRARSGTAPRISATEELAAWTHLLRRLDPLARDGILVMDLYEANVLLPMTQGVAGQLRLGEPILIDHAHTVAPGMNLRRPALISSRMARIAPELREALQQDQQALYAHFADHAASVPGYTHLPQAQDAHSRRIWAEFDRPQALQAQIDAGRMNAAAAMQFAIGTEIRRCLAGPGAQALPQELAAVAERLCAADPQQRFASMLGAAAAMEAALGPLALASAAHWPAIGPATLAQEPGVTASSMTPLPPHALAATRAARDGLTELPPPPRPEPSLRYLAWACVIGAALGGAAAALSSF